VRHDWPARPPRIHRVAITTTDLGRAGVGYDAVLGVLGYRRTIAADILLGWGGQQPEILIYPVEGDDMTPHRHRQAGLQHPAFEVPDQAVANVAGTAAVDSGWTLVHPPQVYDYADGYY
jgi:catechol-2,3-dioxygenase